MRLTLVPLIGTLLGELGDAMWGPETWTLDSFLTRELNTIAPLLVYGAVGLGVGTCVWTAVGAEGCVWCHGSARQTER